MGDPETRSVALSSSNKLTEQRARWPEILFMTSVAGFSMLLGFSGALARTKKDCPKDFSKGLIKTSEMPETGASLAMRALGRGTLYAVGGFSVFCFAVWKAMGVKDLKEFRQKAGEMLPRIPKSENPGRTEFESLRDFLQYCIDESEKSKKK